MTKQEFRKRLTPECPPEYADALFDELRNDVLEEAAEKFDGDDTYIEKPEELIRSLKSDTAKGEQL